MFWKVKRAISNSTMQHYSAKQDVLLILSAESLFCSFYAMR